MQRSRSLYPAESPRKAGMSRSTSIRAAAPQIFRRPLLFVNPDDSILQVATFLAPGLQIYVDGLVVLDGWKHRPKETILLDGKLPTGTVMHPDLSLDARRVAVVHSEKILQTAKKTTA